MREIRARALQGRAAARHATASSSATASRRWPGTPGGISRPGTASLGIGAIYHTVNPRLFPEQIAWIVNHAEDRVMIARPDLRAAAGEARRQAADASSATSSSPTPRTCRQTTLKNAVAYEDWIGEVDGDFAWKSVRREHRRRHVLHVRHHRQSQGRALLAPLQRAARADGERCPTRWACRSRDVVLPVVPMFHANGWALAFSGADGGRRRWCMPGAKLDGASIYELLERLQGDVHRRGADGLADAAAASAKQPAQAAVLCKRVVIGGSACPRAMTKTFQDDYGVEVIHAWGMTEMSPLGTLVHDEAGICRDSTARRGSTSS